MGRPTGEQKTLGKLRAGIQLSLAEIDDFRYSEENKLHRP
jgi:hypothetical protein